MSKYQEEFLVAISNSGLTPPDKIIADGVPHRFVSEVGSNKKNGWFDIMSRFYYNRKNNKELNDKYGDLKVFVNGQQIFD